VRAFCSWCVLLSRRPAVDGEEDALPFAPLFFLHMHVCKDTGRLA
jgi:hypothetical protein